MSVLIDFQPIMFHLECVLQHDKANIFFSVLPKD